MSGKSSHIRRFLNDLVGGLACSISRACLDLDEVRFGIEASRYNNHWVSG
jgi:hypothetical protein